MRMWMAFKSKKEQKEWELSQEKKNENFRVCMRMTPRELEKDLFMDKGSMSEFKAVTVYTYDRY